MWHERVATNSAANMKQSFRAARTVIRSGVACAILIVVLAAAPVSAQQARHGLSLFGALKYPPTFRNFDYVNPAAPKGGTLRIGATGTFDSLNPFILKGTAASLSGMIYDTLMARAADEPSAEYGLIAKSVSHPPDFSSATFVLRDEARWHDGQPITPEDVIFSLKALKDAHPRYAYYYANIREVKKTGRNEVTFYFNTKGNRELPLITGELVVLPKHYWEGVNDKGEKRKFSAGTLEPPLGSGPYRIGTVRAGKSLTLERVENYWAKDLPINAGRNNFDRLKVEYFRDATIELEAFKADVVDVRSENSAKNWATAYDFPAARRGDVILEVIATKNVAAMQAFVFNTRRAKFSDRRVRQAFNLAFDFEWANKNLFYGQYKRLRSYFDNSELAATGLPQGKELEILSEVRADVPAEVFTKVYENPVNGDAGKLRRNLRKARKLLNAAGWRIVKGALSDAKSGERMSVEFLLVSPAFERIVLPFKKNLERLGIEVSVRTVDVSQYRNRLDNFDYDIIVGGWGQSLSPGNEQRNYWGSATAGRKGSRNYAGIKNKAIDHLIDRIIFAKDRAELVAATRALDRVLIWNAYVIPNWYTKGERIARWNRFSMPAKRPDYGTGFFDTWWFDPAKAKSVKNGRS